MKRILIVILLLSLVGCASGETYYTICSPGSSVNIRHKPSTASEICGYLELGWDVEVSDEARDNRGRLWYRVEDVTEYGYGWVMASYLSGSPVELRSHECVVVADGRVAVRESPDGKRKSWVRPGDRVSVILTSNGWALTKKGYISTDYLKEGP